MAASPKPEVQTVRIPFIEESEFRGTDTTKDNRFVNGFFEPLRNPIKNLLHYYFVKRPGMSQNVRPSGGAGTGRGVFVWRGLIYSVIGTKIFKGSTDLGVTLGTSTGLCKFAISRPGAATQYLFVNDGQALYTITTADVVTQVVTNFPANTRDLAYLNQYLFVLDSSANLWNSDPDLSSWDGTSYITSQMLPGTGRGIARHGSEIVVFTDQHFQMFYDNANASGSPLNNADGKMKQIGCVSNDTIAQLEDITFWVGNGLNGGHTVWKMDSEVKSIGSQTIDKLISAEGSSLTASRALAFRVAGHIFYALTLTSANRTFIYDVDLGLWAEWTDAAGTAAWPIVSVAQINQGLIGQHPTNGWIYNISPTVYQDDSTSFTVTARTPRIDLDTMRRKFVARLDVVADVQTSSENVSVSYSDNDYASFSTARTFDLSRVRSFGQSWGNFRRRAWQLQYSGTQAYRCYGLEIDVTLEDQ
jgi:hypothetical protein